MTPSVRRALAELGSGPKSAMGEQGEAWLDQLAAQKQYLVDVWSAG
jgi:sulfite reductase alpha subunit-like flavoprotein